ALLAQATSEPPELLALLRELGLRSSMCVPLIARDRVLGAITFIAAETGRRYDEHDLAIALDLARRAATAVDNALLFRDAQAARRQVQDSLAVVDAIFAAAPVGLAFMDTRFKYVRVNGAPGDEKGPPGGGAGAGAVRGARGGGAGEPAGPVPPAGDREGRPDPRPRRRGTERRRSRRQAQLARQLLPGARCGGNDPRR